MSNINDNFSNYQESNFYNIDDLKKGKQEEDFSISKEKMALQEKVNDISSSILISIDSDDEGQQHLFQAPDISQHRISRRPKTTPKLVEGTVAHEVSAPNLDKVQQAQHQVLQELASTEESYQEALETLFYKNGSSIFEDAQKIGKDFLNDDQKETLQTLHEAYLNCLQVSKEISQHLEIAGDPQYPLAARLSHANEALESTCDARFLMSLAEISNGLNDLRAIQKNLRENSPGWCIFERVFQNKNGRKSIGDQLITPIQRLPRYQMLAASIEKKWEHPEEFKALRGDLKATQQRIEASLAKLDHVGSEEGAQQWASEKILPRALALTKTDSSFWSSHQQATHFQEELNELKFDLELLKSTKNPGKTLLKLQRKIEHALNKAEALLSQREEFYEQLDDSRQSMILLQQRPTHFKYQEAQQSLKATRKAIKKLPVDVTTKQFFSQDNKALIKDLPEIKNKLDDYGSPLHVAKFAAPFVSLAPRAWDNALRQRGEPEKTDCFNQFGQVVAELVDELLSSNNFNNKQQDLIERAWTMFQEADELQQLVQGKKGEDTPDQTRAAIQESLENLGHELGNISQDLDGLGLLGTALKGALEGSITKFYNLAKDEWKA